MWIVKDNGFIKPAYNEDHDEIGKLKEGVIYKISKPKKVRNPRFHRYFFALIRIAFDNQEQYNNMDDLRYVMTMKAGYYRTIYTDKGKIYLPESLSFDNMDEDTFRDVFDKVLHVICKEFGFDPETLKDEVYENS